MQIASTRKLMNLHAKQTKTKIEIAKILYLQKFKMETHLIVSDNRLFWPTLH